MTFKIFLSFLVLSVTYSGDPLSRFFHVPLPAVSCDLTFNFCTSTYSLVIEMYVY